MVGQGSCLSSAPRIVDVNVNKNTKIFMTFGMPPLSKVEKIPEVSNAVLITLVGILAQTQTQTQIWAQNPNWFGPKA